MIAATSIRYATEHDTETLKRLAELDSQRPLTGTVLVAGPGGVPAAALSLEDGRVVADPFQRTDHLLAGVRMRAGAVRAFEVTPSVSQRILAALPSQRGNSVVAYS